MTAKNGSARSSGVQAKMLALLADGLPHSRKELHACLVDELGAIENIRPHITHLRKLVRTLDMDILCVFVKRRTAYRLVCVRDSCKRYKRLAAAR